MGLDRWGEIISLGAFCQVCRQLGRLRKESDWDSIEATWRQRYPFDWVTTPLWSVAPVIRHAPLSELRTETCSLVVKGHRNVVVSHTTGMVYGHNFRDENLSDADLPGAVHRLRIISERLRSNLINTLTQKRVLFIRQSAPRRDDLDPVSHAAIESVVRDIAVTVSNMGRGGHELLLLDYPPIQLVGGIIQRSIEDYGDWDAVNTRFGSNRGWDEMWESL